jgi:2-oxoglutarate dehydrogenase E1 component
MRATIPLYTQPLMYQQVEAHRSVTNLWAEELERRGLLASGQAERMMQDQLAELQRVADARQPARDVDDAPPEPPPPGAAKRAATSVPAGLLRDLNAALLAAPTGFTVNSKLLRVLDRRKKVFAAEAESDVVVDWSTAEALALASILADGTPIRFTGEDVERATFSQRHAVWHDANTGEQFVPLQALPQARAAFEIHNSPLSEAALVGFEYGYSIYDPRRLVIWEAQYGDFVNGAQVLIDEYVMSARAKWGHTPSLVCVPPATILGPNHSSACRALCYMRPISGRASDTAAQFFHTGRRQAALPMGSAALVVLTPKSLLRVRPHDPGGPVEGGQPVIDDPPAENDPRRSETDLCTGKVYFDLVAWPGQGDPAPLRGRAACLLPAEEMGGLIDTAGKGRCLGAGGAGEHGRVGLRAAQAAGAAGRLRLVALSRPAPCVESIRRLNRVACSQSERIDRASIRGGVRWLSNCVCPSWGNRWSRRPSRNG